MIKTLSTGFSLFSLLASLFLAAAPQAKTLSLEAYLQSPSVINYLGLLGDYAIQKEQISENFNKSIDIIKVVEHNKKDIILSTVTAAYFEGRYAASEERLAARDSNDKLAAEKLLSQKRLQVIKDETTKAFVSSLSLEKILNGIIEQHTSLLNSEVKIKDSVKNFTEFLVKATAIKNLDDDQSAKLFQTAIVLGIKVTSADEKKKQEIAKNLFILIREAVKNSQSNP